MRTDEIVNKAFSRSFMGYDIEQVDAFLDEVIDCLEQYESEKREMLSAMEYLLGKLESGQKLPLAEMRRMIGEGKPSGKRLETAERGDKRRAQAQRALPSGQQQEKRARAISRREGKTAAKPKEGAGMKRAPRVQRVAKAHREEREAVAIEYETGESAPRQEDWLDGLLDEIPSIEHAAKAPQSANAHTETAKAEPKRPQADESGESAS